MRLWQFTIREVKERMPWWISFWELLPPADIWQREWIAEAGEYIFEIGTSSRDLPVSVKFHLTGHTLYDFGLRSSIKRISASKEAFRILQETFEPYGVTYADFADCLKYFPDKELGVIVEELINNKHLNREDPELIKVIEQMYKKLTDLPVE